MSLMKRFGVGCAFAALLAFATPAPAVYAQDRGGAKQDMKDAGKHVKKAAKKTGHAAKHAAKATKRSAKSAKRAAKGHRVTATCSDGTTYSGRTRSGACAGHGGVREWRRG